MKLLSAILISLLLFAVPAALEGQACDPQPTVMHAQTQTGQDISMVLVGAVELHDAASELHTLDVEVNADTSIHSGPGPEFPEVGAFSAGERVQVHAENCSHQWLRTVLEDGQAGWFSARNVTVMGDLDTLPVANLHTPVYASMQAFTLDRHTEAHECADVSLNGVLIQVPADTNAVPLQVNGIAMMVNGTLFVQTSETDGQMIEVLAGEAQVTLGDFTTVVPRGNRVIIAPTDGNLTTRQMRVEPYAPADFDALPVSLLPESIDVTSAFNNTAPQIVGLERCRVISNSSESVCPLHFVNRDGDAITRIDVEFVSAPQGEWTGSVYDNPLLVRGDSVSGALAWTPTCSLGAPCFIGPVVWSITLTDAAGHVSEPFQASFNCVAD